MPAVRLTLLQLQLLLGMTVVWGINWPVMKYAVTHYTPLSFRFFCMLLGAFIMWGLAAAMKVSLRVPKALWGRMLWLCLPNMIGWHVFCVLAVKELSSGRAAILGYTMPVWTVLTGLLFKHPVGARGWIGLALAMVATLLLLSSEFNAIAGSPLGVLLMCIAAGSWGLGTTLIKRFPVDLHPLAFTHFMMWPTMAAMGTLAVVLEGLGPGHLPTTWPQIWPIVYNAVGVFAFAQVGWFTLAKSLPPVASSLSVMMIPVVGVMAGAFFLGEAPHWPDFAALGLILTAMVVVLLPRRTA
ncbi:DMT family transporter [Limnobacter humi]|uniref:DMT family transporter n=1 Tax=Limnobacter humi TaxID=1778671 RepID=A0ABT1WBU7_9BURK|nr:DMT family transporter [Limnobacter humi]MCQ8894980.1 DMT family transporter [Limnobacter humi]